ncbi:MAG: acyl-CoA dehydrogenase family protein [Novosphingobium sp.]
MNFDLSAEQEMFRASVERFAASLDGEGRKHLRAAPGGYARERWGQLAEMGLIALVISEAAGGMGGSRIDLAVVGEAIGRSIAPDPWLENGILPAQLLAAARRDEILAEVLDGSCFVACALAERGQRFSLAPKAVTARRTGAGYVLHGEKTFVLGGAGADRILVSADCDGAPAYFLIPADRAGVIRHPYRLVDGSLACELRLTDAKATDNERLAIDQAALAGVVATVRLLAAAEMLGLAQRLFDDTLCYVKQREQFGVAIGTFQVLQHRLVDCYAALEQSRSLVYRAALADPGEREAWYRSAAGAKSYVAVQADLIAREAVQMHGGMGITDELAIGHAMKRVLLLGRLFGDEEATLAEYAEAA